MHDLTKEEKLHYKYTKLFTRLVFKSIHNNNPLEGKEYKKWLLSNLNKDYKLVKRLKK